MSGSQKGDYPFSPLAPQPFIGLKGIIDPFCMIQRDTSCRDEDVEVDIEVEFGSEGVNADQHSWDISSLLLTVFQEGVYSTVDQIIEEEAILEEDRPQLLGHSQKDVTIGTSRKHGGKFVHPVVREHLSTTGAQPTLTGVVDREDSSARWALIQVESQSCRSARQQLLHVLDNFFSDSARIFLFERFPMILKDLLDRESANCFHTSFIGTNSQSMKPCEAG